MDIVIEDLVVEEDRLTHIAKHDVVVGEVLEVAHGDYVFIKGKHNRWLLIGKTKKERFLTIVIGERKQKNIYGLVTARPASREERDFYNEFTFQYAEGGEEDGQS